MSDRPKLPRKRLYVFDGDDSFDSCRFAVVRTSLKEAKKWLWNDFDVRDCCGGEYILFNPYWLKHVDVSDREVGDHMMCIEGIERGVYSWIDGERCPICRKIGNIQRYDDWDKVCCSECDDKLYEAREAQTGGEK